MEPQESFSPQAVTILSTEHWGLLSLRSMSWNESFSRTSVFLNSLSAFAVALALVADAKGFGRAFTYFAAVLFPIVLFLGMATYVRLVDINMDDMYITVAMNRLRSAYVRIAPEVEPYFTTGHTTDQAGLWASLTLGKPRTSHVAHVFVTTPTVVGMLNAILVAAGVAFISSKFALSAGAVTVLTVLAFIGAAGALLWYQASKGLRFIKQAGTAIPRSAERPDEERPDDSA